jgi:hypothetical protein
MSRERICVPARGGRVHVSQFRLVNERREKGKRRGIKRGTHCLRGDNVVSLLLVEPRHALDDHVIALCRTRGEDDILFLCSNEARYVL